MEGRGPPAPLTQSAAHSKIERRASPSPSQNLPPLLPYKLPAHNDRPPHTQLTRQHTPQHILDFQNFGQIPNQSPCRKQLRADRARLRRSAARRTLTHLRGVSLPTCSLPTNSGRMYERRTPVFLSARSARSSVSGGRPSATSSGPLMRPRRLPIRSGTRTRNRRTMPRPMAMTTRHPDCIHADALC